MKLLNLPGRIGRPFNTLIETVWRELLRQSAWALGISALFYRLLLGTFASAVPPHMLFREMAEQIYRTAIRGAFILLLSSLMFGLLVIVHATQQLVKVQGEEFVGWLLVTIVVRELGPVWAATFVLLYSGSAITVDIGAMSVGREIDALKMMGIDPYCYLGVPRFWGLTISVVALYLLCALSAVIGGFLFSQIFAEIFWGEFWRSFINALQWVDLGMGLFKAIIFGMLIATVSLYFGLEAREHMGEVVNNTSHAAIWSLVLCGNTDILITMAYYL